MVRAYGQRVASAIKRRQFWRSFSLAEVKDSASTRTSEHVSRARLSKHLLRAWALQCLMTVSAAIPRDVQCFRPILGYIIGELSAETRSGGSVQFVETL